MTDFRVKTVSGTEEFIEASKEELRVLIAVRESGTLSPESEAELREAIIACKEKFLGKN